MKYLLFALIMISASGYAETFRAHCRERAPELIPIEGGCTGPVAEIVELAVQRIGHSVEWSHVPWARTINLAKIGTVDIIPRHSMNRDRERYLHAVAYGYSIREVYYMISPKKDIEVNTFDDLLKYRIGALRGSYYSDTFAKASNLQKDFFKHTPQIIQMLKSGRIDVAITSSNHDEEMFRGIKGVKQARYIEYFYNGRYLSIPKESRMSKYFDRLKKAIEEMIESGEIDAIFLQYGLSPPSQR
ncbi:substrate-binding periplasmic protein [Vibrio sp. HN007]|uniref:substrate-binding periplasmic protein n=1 Tax=Vibrio iocasae TaxID=3098914 RepID=UPI0035D40C9C